jgi:DNA (cytosine-5)-methyltransferase 1
MLGVIMLRRYKTIDLFSGCGGMSLGFQNAGFEILAALIIETGCGCLLKLNFEHPIYSEDLADENVQKRIKHLSQMLIIGRSPCQDFSSAGHRDENLGPRPS